MEVGTGFESPATLFYRQKNFSNKVAPSGLFSLKYENPEKNIYFFCRNILKKNNDLQLKLSAKILRFWKKKGGGEMIYMILTKQNKTKTKQKQKSPEAENLGW